MSTIYKFVLKTSVSYTLTQLYGQCIFLYSLPQPLIICLSVKRPLVIQGLLADYDAKPIGAGLGRDSVVGNGEG